MCSPWTSGYTQDTDRERAWGPSPTEIEDATPMGGAHGCGLYWGSLLVLGIQAVTTSTMSWMMMQVYLVLATYIGTCWTSPTGLWSAHTCAYVRQSRQAVRKQPMTQAIVWIASMAALIFVECKQALSCQGERKESQPALAGGVAEDTGRTWGPPARSLPMPECRATKTEERPQKEATAERPWKEQQ